MPGSHSSAGFLFDRGLNLNLAKCYQRLMHSPHVQKFLLGAGLAAVLMLSACSPISLGDGLVIKRAADETKTGALSPDLARSDDQQVAGLYNTGLELMNKGRYSEATKKFSELERLHPYSKWATKGLLMQAFSNYQDNKYSDAINAAQRFISLHPGHESSDYAYYMIALSQYEQIGDVQRDQSQTQRALDALEEVARRFPDSRYAADAQIKARLARDHLAAKDMDIGRYYYRKGDWLAGINRFKDEVTTYQQTSQTPEALYRLAEGYMALGIRPEAQTAAAVLGHNFPTSTWYRDAYRLVATDGRDPTINSSSWIAKSFALGLN